MKSKINQLSRYYFLEGLSDITDGGLVHSGFELIKKICNVYIENQIRYLDVGSAECYYIEKLIETDPSVDFCVGIDISTPKLRKAHERITCNEFHIVNSTWDLLPFRERVFNLVTFFDGLEHSVDPKKPLIQIGKILDNGFLILTTIVNDPIISLPEILETMLNRIIYKFTGRIFRGHLNWFTISRVKNLISKNYEIVGMRTNLNRIKLLKKIKMQLKSVRLKTVKYLNYLSKHKVIRLNVETRTIFSIAMILKNRDIHN